MGWGIHPGRWAHSAAHAVEHEAGTIARTAKADVHQVGHSLVAGAKSFGRAGEHLAGDVEKGGAWAAREASKGVSKLEHALKDLYCNTTAREALGAGAGAYFGGAQGAQAGEQAAAKAPTGGCHKNDPPKTKLNWFERALDKIETIVGLKPSF